MASCKSFYLSVLSGDHAVAYFHLNDFGPCGARLRTDGDLGFQHGNVHAARHAGDAHADADGTR